MIGVRFILEVGFGGVLRVLGSSRAEGMLVVQWIELVAGMYVDLVVNGLDGSMFKWGWAVGRVVFGSSRI